MSDWIQHSSINRQTVTGLTLLHRKRVTIGFTKRRQFTMWRNWRNQWPTPPPTAQEGREGL